MLERIEKHVNLKTLKRDIRRLGVNLMTAGLVGVFINHFVGTALSTMFWAATSMGILGFCLSYIGNAKRRLKK